MQLNMVSVRQLDDEATLLVHFEWFGRDFHGMFIQVEDVEDQVAGGVFQEPVNDPHGRYEAMCVVDDGGCFETVKVPGFEGDYVLVLTPYCQ